MKKLYMLTVKGHWHEWGFPVKVDERFLKDWEKDGLSLEKIEFIVPTWWVEWGLPVRWWAWLYETFILED